MVRTENSSSYGARVFPLSCWKSVFKNLTSFAIASRAFFLMFQFYVEVDRGGRSAPTNEEKSILFQSSWSALILKPLPIQMLIHLASGQMQKDCWPPVELLLLFTTKLSHICIEIFQLESRAVASKLRERATHFGIIFWFVPTKLLVVCRTSYCIFGGDFRGDFQNL
jgi:hypothetical protein